MEKQLIPAGYKQTEVGVIPEDWDVHKLGDIGQNIIGLTYSPNDVSDYGTLVLRSSNVQNNQLAFENNVFVNMDLPERVIVRENDILICVRNGSKQLIGKCALIDKATAGVAFGAFMSIYRSEYNGLIFFQFQSDNIQNQINEVMGATINQITNKDMASFIVPLPSNKKEQTAIANALSDVDALIAALENLINKKSAIKTAAMQQLLTGKKRLPPFDQLNTGYKQTELGEIPGDWEVRTINDLNFDLSDGNYSSKYPRSDEFKPMGIPFIRANNIKMLTVVDEDMRFISEEKHSEITKGHLKEGDVLITNRGEIGNLAIVPNRHIGSNINAQIVRINTNGTCVINRYFAYYLQKDEVKQKLLDLQTGSALKQLPVNRLKTLEIIIPSKEEQAIIANVLSDMDKDLEALQQRLQKTQQIKQGMMQELLTGKTRLI